jgi:hypothetical protein
MSYGFAICNFSLSIDEEYALQHNNTVEWLAQGRWGTVLLKNVLRTTYPFPFFQPALAVMLLGASALAWCFAFVEASEEKLERSPWLTLFAVLYLSFPTNSYYLSFNTYNTEISTGLVVSALFALLSFAWVVGRGGQSCLLAAVLLSALSIGIYQSFLVLNGIGITAMLLVNKASRKPGAEVSAEVLVRRATWCALPLLAGLVLHAAITRFLPTSPYVNEFFNWGKLNAVFIVHWLGSYLAAIVEGRGFIGGWLIWPLLVAGIASMAALCVGPSIQERLVGPIMVLVLLVAPYLLSFGLGAPMPNRAQQMLPLAYSVFLLVLAVRLNLQQRGRAALMIATGLVMLWNGQANTKLFFSEYMSYKRDEAVAHQVADRLYAEGWQGEPMPLYVRGELSDQRFPHLYSSETIGKSFFGWDGGTRAPVFMRVFGYPLSWPTAQQTSVAAAVAEQMPVWPAKGSVKLFDGIGIVNMTR